MLTKWVELVILLGFFVFFMLVFVLVIVPYYIILKTYRFFRLTFCWIMGVDYGRF